MLWAFQPAIAKEPTMHPTSLLILPPGVLQHAGAQGASRSPHGERIERSLALLACLATLVLATLAALA